MMLKNFPKILHKSLIGLLVLWASTALAQYVPIESIKKAHIFEEEYETKDWQEILVKLPTAPKQENLVSFFVSSATQNLFFVDLESISLGKDGVVRYILVIKSSGGATNVSYEGMRCTSRERRAYAFGRSDGSWSKARNNAWAIIRDESANRYHAALFFEYFCPGGVIASRLEDVHFAFRHQEGGAPRVTIGQ